MNALAYVDNQGSFFDLDYISGKALPRHPAMADYFLDQFQLIAEMDTLTGSVPEIHLHGLSLQDYANAVSEWRANEKIDPVLDSIRKFRAGEPRDRVAPRSSFEPLQEWEGYVISMEGGEFIARLLDVTAEATSETEQAKFSLDDVSDDDRSLVQIGAIFRWSVGYEKNVSGTRCKKSALVFRRLPIWTKKEIEDSRKKASVLIESIDWE
jgi:hypothetical protein